MTDTHYLYAIINKITGKIYIGITNRLKDRWRHHKTRSSNHYLKSDVELYGVDEFIFYVWQTFTIRKDCLNAEISWISFLRKQGAEMYNISDGGETPGKISPEGLEKLKRINSGPNHPQYGKERSQVTKDKLSKALLGKPGRAHSDDSRAKITNSKIGKNVNDDTRKKLREAFNGKPRPKPMAPELKLQIKREYREGVKMIELSIKYNYSMTSIKRAITGKR